MTRRSPLPSLLFPLVLVAALPWLIAAQGRPGGRPGGGPAPVARPPAGAPLRVAPHPPTTRGTVVFIGGYFYDPFFGPYPWWPRVAYPYWYAPLYDMRALVRVKATPEQAAVYVDGFYAGIVEDFDGLFERLPLTPGGHDITLFLQGYETTRWRLYLQPGSDLTLHAAMHATAPGAPSEPPMLAPPVPAPPDGTYSVPSTPARLTGPVHTPPAVVAGFGTIVLQVKPATATVRIDGVECVTSAPGYVEAYVAPGSHTVTVSLAGHAPFSREVLVEQGKSATLNVSLPPS